MASVGAIPIDFTQEDPVQKIMRDLPNGVRRSVDCCGFESVNSSLQTDRGVILRQAIAVTGQAGGIGVMGVYSGGKPTKGAPLETEEMASVSLPVAQMWIKGLSMRTGAFEGLKLAPALTSLICSGKARPEFIISSEIDIEQAPEFYKRFSDHQETKVLIRFNVPHGAELQADGVSNRSSMASDATSMMDGQESKAMERLRNKMAKVDAVIGRKAVHDQADRFADLGY